MLFIIKKLTDVLIALHYTIQVNFAAPNDWHSLIADFTYDYVILFFQENEMIYFADFTYNYICYYSFKKK